MATDTVPPTAKQESDTITIRVNPELARAYREASPEERRKWHLVVEFSLRTLMNSTPESLARLMDDMSRKAREAGLTEAELNDILREWDEERKAAQTLENEQTQRAGGVSPPRTRTLGGLTPPARLNPL